MEVCVCIERLVDTTNCILLMNFGNPIQQKQKVDHEYCVPTKCQNTYILQLSSTIQFACIIFSLERRIWLEQGLGGNEKIFL